MNAPSYTNTRAAFCTSTKWFMHKSTWSFYTTKITRWGFLGHSCDYSCFIRDEFKPMTRMMSKREIEEQRQKEEGKMEFQGQGSEILLVEKGNFIACKYFL